MKKIYLLLALALFVGRADAQELAVKSFEYKQQELYGKISPRFDNNEDACALLRVCSTIEGLTIEGNLGHVGEIEKPRPSEYWIYLPVQTRRVQINHPDYLPLTYIFKESLQKYATYELVLESLGTRAKPTMSMQYLSLTVTPADAIVLIDDIPQELTNGTLALKLPFGEHTYSISSSSHHMQKGSFEITEKGTTELVVSLVEAMGTLVVDASPVEGAQVLVDGKSQGRTPCEVRLSSGSHYVQVIKDGYAAYSTTVRIEDGKTAKLAVRLNSKSAEVTLKATHAHSEIWIDGKQYGVGSWRGALLAGVHTVEARTEGYETVEETLIVEEGRSVALTLKAPEPIYCMVEITSNPMGAEVWLDGKYFGKTPYMSNEITAGNHTLELRREGYKAYVKSIQLKQERHNAVNVALSSSASDAPATTSAQNRFEVPQTPSLKKRSALRGFQHSIELSGGYSDLFGASLDWVGGYRFSDYVFLGGGVGMGVQEIWDYYSDYYYYYYDDASGFYPALKLFIQPKFYFTKKKVAPIFALSVGGIWYIEEDWSLYLSPDLGIDIKMGKRSLSVAAGVDLTFDIITPHLKIGFTF